MPIHPAMIAPFVVWSIWMAAFVALKIQLDPRAHWLYSLKVPKRETDA